MDKKSYGTLFKHPVSCIFFTGLKCKPNNIYNVNTQSLGILSISFDKDIKIKLPSTCPGYTLSEKGSIDWFRKSKNNNYIE